MGIFRRKKKQSDDTPAEVPTQASPTPEIAADGPRDESLPVLSVAQADHLRAVSRQVLAARGQEAAVHGAALALDDGSTFGLDNLSRQVAPLPVEQWSAVVEGHMASMLDHPKDAPFDPDTLVVKVRSASDLPEGFLEYQPLEPLPGVLGILAADLPTVVQEFGHTDKLGMGRDEAFDRGLRNLAAMPMPQVETVLVEENSLGSQLHALHGDDFFVGARVMILPHVLKEVLGRAIPKHGVLVSVPARSRLLVHFPQGPETVPVINAMAHMTIEMFNSEPGPISPFLFHVTPDLLATQLTWWDEESIQVRVEGPVRDMFVALGLIEE